MVSYNNSTQTADVRPMVKRQVPTDDETGRIAEELPVIPTVPVIFPNGGDFFISFPLAVGDTGLLVFSERSIQSWRQTGDVSDPGDVCMHDIESAVFIPGLRTAKDPISGTSGSNMVIAKEGGLAITVTASQMQVGGSSDAAALASVMESWKTIFNSHTHPAPGGATSATATPFTGSAASTKLKVGG